MKKIIALAALLASVNAFADVSNGKPVLSCKSSDSAVSFEIRNTAVPTFKQGVLSTGGAVVKMKCVEVDEQPAPGSADIPNRIWSCTESRAGDGRYLVDVTQGGFAGLTEAQVSIEQIFPVPAQELEHLYCKN